MTELTLADDERLIAGRYRLGALIGRGGMSEVHEGIDTRLRRKVAIKLLKSSLAVDPAFRTRFKNEAQAASRMAHPTIVRIYDAGEDTTIGQGGTQTPCPFIIMEYVEGRLLKDIIAEGPMDPAEAVRIANGILTALEYSHEAGVIHRDIKPGNIMITGDGRVKVMDFGIARAVSDGSATVAQTTAILGTASYFSPEQAKGESVDARTDLYSTGIVLFEMLTGVQPFTGDTAVSIAYQHVSEQPRRPSAVNSDVSPQLDAVVMIALAKDRAQRYQTGVDFREDLEAALSGTMPTRGPSEMSFLLGKSAENTRVQRVFKQLADDERTPRKQSRPPVMWLWAGVVMLLIILVAVIFWVTTLQRVEIVPVTTRVVPSLAGLNYEAAENILLSNDLEARQAQETNSTVPKGLVIETRPGEGTMVNQETTITVVISLGKPTAVVPDIIGQLLAGAQTSLSEAKLVYGAISRENSPTVPADVVMRADPTVGEGVTQGETVNLTVSTGNVFLPDVRGQSLSAALDILGSGNLQLGTQPQPDATCPAKPHSPITAQSLPPGDVPQKSTVILTYCAGA